MTTEKLPLYTAAPCRPSTMYRGLYVASVGHIARKTTRVRARFALPAVGLVVAGTGTFSSGRGAAVGVGPGTLFGVHPGPAFDYGPTAWWEEYYLGFAGPGAAALVEGGLIPSTGGPRRVASPAVAARRMRGVLRLCERGGPGDVDRACLLGVQLLLDLHDAPPPLRAAADPIERVLAICRARLHEPLDFARLADDYDVSYSLLRQRIRRQTGLAPAKYLTRLRCEAACASLATTALPIKRIARDVGIADPYTFSRTFRRTVGLSPQAYRDRQRVYGGPREAS